MIKRILLAVAFFLCIQAGDALALVNTFRNESTFQEDVTMEGNLTVEGELIVAAGVVKNIDIIGYVTATAQATFINTASWADMNSMSITIPARTAAEANNEILVVFNGEISNSTAAANTFVILDIDGSNVAVTERNRVFVTSGDEIGVMFFHKTTLSAASHTIKVRNKVSAGTGHVEERQLMVIEIEEN